MTKQFAVSGRGVAMDVLAGSREGRLVTRRRDSCLTRAQELCSATLTSRCMSKKTLFAVVVALAVLAYVVRR
jgi:hypothetical protein